MTVRAFFASVLFCGMMLLAAVSRGDSPQQNTAERTSGIHGALVICGGMAMPDDVRDAFFGLAGGDKAQIVLLATAHGIAEREPPESVIAFWKRAEFRQWPVTEPASVTCLHTLSKEKADTDDFIEPLQKATAVWILGGTQSTLSYVYRGTRVERELHALLDRGGVIGGTSAGAAIMSQVMLDSPANEAPSVYHGFDLLPGAIIDMHFRQRNRLQRLFEVCREYPQRVGYGIDEHTAMLVRGETIRVLGEGQVQVCLGETVDRPCEIFTRRRGGEFNFVELNARAEKRTGR